MKLLTATAVRVSVSGPLVRIECSCGDGSAVLSVGGNSDSTVRISWLWFLLGAALGGGLVFLLLEVMR